MTSRPLVPDRDEFTPNQSLKAPVIWIWRLMIFERPGLPPIREVTFRPGLNIIATAIPEPTETRPVGHDVGKTLLTRLIRYCLGESTYAKSAVRAAIEREFPEGFVVAEVYAGGELWTVSRPLVLERRSKSQAWRGMSWDEVNESVPHVQIHEFIQVLESLTVGQFPEIILPGLGRNASWRDLLGWLSRDQHCAYRDPLEWRAAWTESGSPELNAEVSSLIVRLVMDLVDVEEGKLIQRRKRMMWLKKGKANQHQTDAAALAQKRSFLLTHLKVDDELLESDLFGSAAVRQLEDEIQQVRSDLEALAEASGLTAVLKHRRDAASEVRRVRNTVRLRVKDRDTEEKQKERNETATGDDLLEELGDLGSGCPAFHAPCPLNSENKQTRERRAYRAALVSDSIRRIRELDHEIASLSEELKPLQRALATIRIRHRKIARRTVRVEEKKRQHLAKLEAIQGEANSYGPLRDQVKELAKSIKRLKKKLEKLKIQQRSLLEQNSRKLSLLNESVRSVQRRVLGRDVEPSIQINVNRLTFSGDDGNPAPGEGMATSATLSMDLGCLRAALSGLGFHPRLIIHDSPRGGDLEAHLYAQLFLLATELEKAFSSPPFQYILATTTHPPEELLKEPYLRLMLDARETEKLLLKRRLT